MRRMGEDRVTESTSVALVRWVGLPVAGAAVVWLLKVLVGWLVTLPWVPFKGPMRLVDSIPEPWATLGALGVGLLGGLVFSFVAHGERLAVTVRDDHLRLEGDEYDASFDRADVSAVFVEKNQLVLLGTDTGELARRPSELDRTRLAAAFRDHGYPVARRRSARRRLPQVGAGHAGAAAGRRTHCLVARAKSSDTDDVKELRAELAKLGVLVRDDGKKQFWRPVEMTWLRVRERLRDNRYTLAVAAADEYPDVPKVAGTPLLTDPLWVPPDQSHCPMWTSY